MNGTRELDGRVALITGGAAGIGEGTARLFAEHGARLVLADVDAARGEALAQELSAQSDCIFVRTDVRDSNAVQALVKAAQAKFERLDVVVNSAGVEGKNNLIHELPEEEFDRVVAINLRGTFLITKYTVPWLIASGGGSIVNVASPFGYIGGAEISPYCASKGGVIQLTRCTAIEYARHNIRANCISPGIVDTPMTERTFQVGGRPAHFDNLYDRMATPREMGEVILFLASARSLFVTGTNVVADGGKTAD